MSIVPVKTFPGAPGAEVRKRVVLPVIVPSMRPVAPDWQPSTDPFWVNVSAKFPRGVSNCQGPETSHSAHCERAGVVNVQATKRNVTIRPSARASHFPQGCC